MDLFGRRAAIALLAGSLLATVGGCNRNSQDDYASYGHLKKSPPSSAKEGESSSPLENRSAAPASPIAGAPTSAVVANRTADAKTANDTARSALAPSLKADVPQTQRDAKQAQIPAVAKAITPKSSAVQPASASGSRQPPLTVASAAKGSPIKRKVQILVPTRSFKPEGAEGALRVSYDDIDLLKVLNMDPVVPEAPTVMPAWLKNLDGQRIRIRGFMYPTFQQTGVHVFGLARDNQICCFGRNPKIYDVFDVVMRSGVTTNYIPNRPFDVVGVFHIRPEADEGKLYRLYEMDDAVVITK